MTLNLSIIPGKDIVRTTVEGKVDLDFAKKTFAEIIATQNISDDHAIIIDARHTSSAMSTTDIWYLAAELDLMLRNRKRGAKAALLAPENDFEKALFLELCAKNRGLNLEAFTDFEEMINWLLLKK